MFFLSIRQTKRREMVKIFEDECQNDRRDEIAKRFHVLYRTRNTRGFVEATFWQASTEHVAHVNGDAFGKKKKKIIDIFY